MYTNHARYLRKVYYHLFNNVQEVKWMTTQHQRSWRKNGEQSKVDGKEVKVSRIEGLKKPNEIGYLNIW
jgi:hypothetical protein